MGAFTLNVLVGFAFTPLFRFDQAAENDATLTQVAPKTHNKTYENANLCPLPSELYNSLGVKA